MADRFPDSAPRYELRVYYEDTDAGGVVYHANYFRFAERARTEALRALGVPHAEMESQHGVIFMVRRGKVDYLAPARLDDALVVTTSVHALRAATVTLVQSVWRDRRRLVTIEVELACLRTSDQRPQRIPPRWRVALAGLLACRETASIGARGDHNAGSDFPRV